MSALPKKAHWPPAYIYFQSAVIALVVWWFTRGFYQDDSYITLVYARNWLEGYGLVWSRGDEPIEGYSNFLFMVLIAGLGWLGMDLVLASRVVSFVGYFGLIAVLFLFTRTIYRQRFATSEKHYAHQINSALTVGLTASAVPVLAWVMGGLEAVLFSFLLTSAVCLVLCWLEFGLSKKLIFAAGIMFGLATMTRMEGLIVWGMTGIVLGIFWLIPSTRKHLDFPRLMLLFLGFMLLIAPWMVWKYSVYGDLLPNTYYAKVYGIPLEILMNLGWLYIFQAFYLPPMLPIASLALMFMMRTNIIKSRESLYLLAIAGFMLWHVFSSGGDHMKYLRFYVPLIPLLVLIIYYACGWLIEKNERHFCDFSGAMVVLSILQFGYVNTNDYLSKGAISGRAVAPYVNENFKTGSIIAINPAGALPYLAPQFRYVDMLGLNDACIARTTMSEEKIQIAKQNLAVGHLKGNGECVLKKNPDYIIFGHAWGSSEPNFISDYEIYDSEEFKQSYRKVEKFIVPPANTLQVLKMNYENFRGQKSQFAKEADLNEENQLLFIYYERIKP
jgi:arabinofuranosyltransferase